MLVLPCYTDGTVRQPDCPSGNHRVESVFLEGHTDSDKLTPHGGLTDNWDLSVLRATNTYRQLTTMRGDLTKLCFQNQGPQCSPILSVSGYADSRPAAPGIDDASKQKNRRIDLRILMATPKGTDLDEIQKQLDKQ
jgi:flagellar motor protein MotB